MRRRWWEDEGRIGRRPWGLNVRMLPVLLIGLRRNVGVDRLYFNDSDAANPTMLPVLASKLSSAKGSARCYVNAHYLRRLVFFMRRMVQSQHSRDTLVGGIDLPDSVSPTTRAKAHTGV